ncbi:oxysterol-binding protein 1-like isoform X5 [Monomorium pharaonis]|uniref:oxysterol-binding protein 1-like isoform X5 n=1 Tax=Monomorium pharaonis TaxID=307658 RepID=UPI00174772F8|nr:oxysterol-binding protein 1-like isoform X5 [Monomorium pharaonis]
MGDPKSQHGAQEMKGWLFKWTNYLKGYQRRWFVLSNGLLSYYRNPAEMSHTCRGTISLHGALIHTVDACTFVVSNGGTQTFHIKASTEVERQQWVTALELAKAKAIQAMESALVLRRRYAAKSLLEEEEEEYQDNDNQNVETASVIKDLTRRLDDLQACNDLMLKQGAALQRALADLEMLEPPSPELAAKFKIVSERATLFRIAANAMINVSFK